MSRTIEVDTKTFVRFWLVILALVLVALFVWRALAGLIIVGIAIFLAVAIQPLARRIDRHISRKKSRRALSSVISLVIVVGLLVFILAVVAPVVINETARFIGQIPEMFEHTFGGWQGINDFGRTFGVDNLQEQITAGLKSFSDGILGNFGGALVASVGTVANLLTGSVLVVVLTLLFMLQGPTLLKQMWNKLEDKNNHQAVTVAQRVVGKMADVVAKYVSGQVIVAVLDGCVVALAVFVLSLLFGFSSGLALPFGMIAMVFYLIPMFGPVIGCALVSLLLFFSSPVAGICFAIFYIVYLQIENNLIGPKIQGNALKLPPLIILVAITIGIYMFGLVGAIVAIPIAGCIKVLIDEYPQIKTLKKE